MKSVRRPLRLLYLLPFMSALCVYSIVVNRALPFTVFTAAFIVCNLLYAVASSFRTELKLQAPVRINEGESVDISLVIWCRGKLPRFVSQVVAVISKPMLQKNRLFLDDGSDGYPMFSVDDTIGLPEDSEEEGDESNRLMDGFVLKQKRQKVARHISFDRRGQVTIKRIKLYFSDPLGIFAIRRTFRVNHRILVRIKPAIGGGMLRLTGSSGMLDTQAKVGKSGEMTEFAGTRPYRTGDELHHIHWPTVGRTGELYVKEYTQSSTDSLLVALHRGDTRGSPKKDGVPPGGEEMLRAMAGLVVELFDRKISALFGANVGKGKMIDIGYSDRALQEFYDELSMFSWKSPSCRFDFLASAASPGLPRSGAVVFCVDPPDRDFLLSIAENARIMYRRIVTVVHESTSEGANLPPGLQTVNYSEERPEEFFSQIRL